MFLVPHLGFVFLIRRVSSLLLGGALAPLLFALLVPASRLPVFTPPQSAVISSNACPPRYQPDGLGLAEQSRHTATGGFSTHSLVPGTSALPPPRTHRGPKRVTSTGETRNQKRRGIDDALTRR